MDEDRISRRSFAKGALLSAASVGAFGVAGPQAASAQQGYPSRPIKFVLPFAAGGVADITSRIAADKLGEKFGQRFIIENQPGPGGIAAARSVITAAPDGYTLGLATNGTSISVAIYNALPFDPGKDFTTISTLGYFDLLFATNAAAQFHTLADFMKAARAQPGKLNVGTITVGGTQNLAAELFKSSAGLDFQIVPYRTTPEIIVALLRNDVQMMVDFYAPMKGALLDKKIVAIGTSGLSRTSYLADVPTVVEAGVKGYEVKSWNGLVGPRDLPADIVGLLNKSLREILAIPDVMTRYADLGVVAQASTPEELRSRMIGDVGKWAAVIARAGIPKQ
jgi:tripartite-type tricarboxylate transporter receptor subunit TctC